MISVQLYHGLEQGTSKNYYEGWVDDLDELLSSHARATVTSYGIRRSQSGNTLLVNKENISTDTQNKVKT